MTRARVVRVLYALACLAALADALTTWAALTLVDGAEEANPLMAALMGHVGIGPGMGVRTVAGVLLAWQSARVAVRGYSLVRWTPPVPLILYRAGLDDDRWYAARARASLGLLMLLAVVTSSVAWRNATIIADLVASGG